MTDLAISAPAYELDNIARSVWAKAGHRFQPGHPWHALYAHLADTANVAGILWDRSAPATQRWVSLCLGLADPRAVISWVAGIHDLGKASPAFQSRVPSLWSQTLRLQPGLDPYRSISKGVLWHNIAGAAALPRLGTNLGIDTISPWMQTIQQVSAGHHGLFATAREIDTARSKPVSYGNDAWDQLRLQLHGYLCKCLGLSTIEGLHVEADRRDLTRIQLWLSGLVILADWIASNTSLFPPDSDIYWQISVRQASTAPETLAWGQGWTPQTVSPYVYHQRFGLDDVALRPIQNAMLDIVQTPTTAAPLIILEAPMGEGKTEAGLVAAEVLAAQWGCNGIVFALPTRASTNAMFERVYTWANRLPGDQDLKVALAYHQAQHHAIPVQLLDVGEHDGCCNVQEAHGWLVGRKRKLLAPLVVCTIDQVLIAALRIKHVSLYQYGLYGKVVMIDEVHAYDAYMSEILKRLLAQMGAAGVPVILLSATLPVSTRSQLVAAYTGVAPEPPDQPPAYPAITVGQPGVGVHTHPIPADIRRALQVHLDLVGIVEPAEIAQMVRNQLLEGNEHIVVVLNTVIRAQQLYRCLQPDLDTEELLLLHSRFTAHDRGLIEQKIKERFGLHRAPGRCVLIGTQIIEQSLDIDADYMITDLAPIDLILQRAGRLHRHDYPHRPDHLKAPRLALVGYSHGDPRDIPSIPQGSKSVYGTWPLLATLELLLHRPNPQRLSFPADIPLLVQALYDRPVDAPDRPWEAQIRMAQQNWEANNSAAEMVAGDGSIGGVDAFSLYEQAGFDPHTNNDRSEQAGLGRVRYGYNSVEIWLVGGSSQHPTWLPGHAPPGAPPLTDAHLADPEIQQGLIGMSILLPSWQLDKVQASGLVHTFPDSWAMFMPVLKYAKCLYLGELTQIHYQTETGWSYLDQSL